MRPLFPPLILLLLSALLLSLIFGLNLGLVTLSFAKLGLDAGSALALLLVSLFGSAINLPLCTLNVHTPPPDNGYPFYGWPRPPLVPLDGRVRVAVNVGGCLVPVLFSAYLLTHVPVPLGRAAGATAVVAVISYLLSRPVPGVGIGMPILVAPVAAALVALWLGGEGEHRAALAYISGSLGVLTGADLLRLPDIRAMNAPVASIGGAGTFDGIFITGLVAVLLS